MSITAVNSFIKNRWIYYCQLLWPNKATSSLYHALSEVFWGTSDSHCPETLLRSGEWHHCAAGVLKAMVFILENRRMRGVKRTPAGLWWRNILRGAEMRSSEAEALSDCLLEQQRPLLSAPVSSQSNPPQVWCVFYLFVLVLAVGSMKLSRL